MNIRITLVIAQYDIEARLVSFYQVVFEYQCFGFGVSDSDFNFGHPCHHGCCLGVGMHALEVAGYTLAKIECLANVNNLVLRVQHLIHARPVCEAAQK